MTRRTGFIVLAIALFVAVLGMGMTGRDVIRPAMAQGAGVPVAHAGYDRTVSPGDMVVLDGTRSSDPDGGKLTLAWSFVSVPVDSTATLSDLTHIKPAFTADLSGDYVIQLVANDGVNSSVADTVTISTDNSAPVASAGHDRAVVVTQTVELDGSGSWDVDGDALTYAWALVSAPSGSGTALSDPSAMRPTIVTDLAGDYVAELVVSDGIRSSDPATVTIGTGNVAPVADAGADLRDETAIIPDGYRSSDANGDALSYSWAVVWGNTGLSDSAIRRPTMSCTAPAGSVCVAQVITSDGVASSQPDTMVIFPGGTNLPPVAEAGPGQAVAAGATVSLDATSSHDVNDDSLNFRWSLISAPNGSTATISNPAAPRPTFTADLPGAYIAQLIVGDGAEDSTPDTVVIGSVNLSPVANAGVDQLDTSRGPTIQLNGAGSLDPNGDLLTYRWSLIELPARSTAVLSDPTAASPTFVADQTGVYMAQLIVGDEFSESVADTVIISAESRLSAYNNIRPVVDAGPDQSGVLLGSIVQLDGSGTTNLDDAFLYYRWALTTKPAGSTAAISNIAAAAPTFVADQGGLYVAQLIALDLYLYSDPLDTVVIKTLNRAPTVDAGPDQSVLVGETVTLNGAGSSDPDGDPLNYAWTLTGKPAGSGASLSGGITATPSFVPDYDGDYTFSLTVDDGEFASAADSVTVTAANQPPVLGAIGPQAVDLGSALTIQLTAADPNPGTTLAFSASLLPLPANASLDATTGLFTFRPDETQAGAYSLTFGVTDGLLTDSEIVSITVNAAPVGGTTAISGRVLDTNVFVVDGTELGVQGVTVSVIDAPAITAATDVDGYFTLSGIPSGLQVLDLDISTVVNAPPGITYAGFREELAIIADVTNNIDRPLYLPRIEAESLTAITGEEIEDVTVTNARLGVSLKVTPGNAKNPDGSNFVGSLSISEVPLALAPASLPDLLRPGLLVTIQPVGVTFLSPAPITFPNFSDLEPGKQLDIWSLDAASGAFAVVGTLEVSADGTKLDTIGSGGIRAADWHFPGPPSPVFVGDADPGTEKPCGCDAETGSSTSLHTGNLKETHSLVGYSSAGQGHSLQFVYNSTAADPRPVITSEILFGANPLYSIPDTISTDLSVAGVNQGQEQFTSGVVLDRTVDEKLRLAVQFDAGGLETGIYPYRKRAWLNFPATSISFLGATSTGSAKSGQIRINNESSSPFGAGWTLSGLNRIRTAGNVLTDGTGAVSQYKPTAGDPFQGAADYGSMTSPNAQVLDDFNGDGNMDIAVADKVTDRIHIMLGDGAGAFSAELITDTAPDIPDTEVKAYFIDTGDFNSDGIRDIATVLGTDGVGYQGILNDLIAIQFGNGDGTFQAPNYLAVYLNSHIAAVADYDSDGHDDIAYGAYSTSSAGTGGVQVLFGDGLGNFPAARTVNLANLFYAGSLVVGDLNADSHPDIVARQSHRIIVYLSNGLGGFSAGTAFPLLWQSGTGTGWKSVAMADFNGDNIQDVAVTSLYYVEIFLGDGAGGFGPSTDFSSTVVDSYSEAISVADFNGDTVLDVITGGYGSVSSIAIMLGDGAGGMGPPSEYQVSDGSFAGIAAVGTADFNGDGAPDLAASLAWGSSVAVLLGTTPGSTTYASPDSDYSTLVRSPDGAFTRTLRGGTVYQFDANGYQTSVTDLTGRTTSYGYDLSNRIATITDAAGLVTTFNYVSDRLDNIVDPGNRITQFQHDAAGNLIRITDPDDTFRQFTYDPHHRLASQTDKRGFSTSYEFDSFGRHVRSVWPDASERLVSSVQTAGLPDIAAGFGTSASPAPAVRPTEATGSFLDGNGNTETRKTNRFGFITERTVATGTPEERTILTDRDANNNVTRIVSPERTTTMTYYDNGLLRARTVTDTTTHTLPYSTAGQSRYWIYTYNALNKVETVDGPRTDVADITSYEYDPVTGNLTKVTNALGHVTEITAYNAYGQPLTMLDANGVQTTLTYFPQGWLQTRTTDSGVGGTPATTGFTYDGAGNMIGTTLPDGSTLAYEYDGMGRVSAIQNGAGERMVYSYNAAGNRTKTEIHAAPTVIDVPGDIVRTSSAVFDDLGRMLKSLGAYVGEEMLYGYDGNGNPFQLTDPLGNVTQSGFDALNRLVRVIDAPVNGISGEASYTYDAAGNRETVTDQRNLVTSYIHDGFGQVIQRISPDSGETIYKYDIAGNRTYRQDARLKETNWTYGVLGRPLTMSFNPVSLAEEVVYIYDDATPGNYGIGGLASVAKESSSTAYIYDADGNVTRVTSVIGTQTYVTAYAYDAANRLASMTYPSGRIIDYTYDTLGRVDSVATRVNELAIPVALASGLAYQPFGGLDAMTYGNNATLALGYDLDGRMWTMDAYNGATAILDLDYGFDFAGNITAITDVTGGPRGRNYIYDALYRLTDASGGIPTETFSYDLVGNRQTRNADSYAYAALSNQLTDATEAGATRNLVYGASGNTATDDRAAAANRTYIYDSTDRLVSVADGGVTLATYLHNMMGQRIAKTVGASVTHYLYDSGGNPIAETDGAGVTQAEYVWFGGMPLAYIAGGVVYYVHSDHLGTPQRLTDGATGTVAWDASYGPFGEATVTGALTFNLRFPGQYLDVETGLYYNGFRDYDPTTGRYIQSDPIGLDGGLNTYGYVGGNPVMRVDPRGLDVLVARYPGAMGFGHVGLGIGGKEDLDKDIKTSGLYPQSGDPGKKIATKTISCGSVPGEVYLDETKEKSKNEELWSMRIPTTARQDAAMKSKMDELLKNTEDYNLCSNNCVDFVKEVLAAGGIKCPALTKSPHNISYDLQYGRCQGTPNYDPESMRPGTKAAMDR